MRRGLLAVLSAGATACLAGCGGSSSVGPIASADASRLRQDVSVIRTAAAAGHPASAHRAVAALHSHVEQMMKTGGLSGVDGRLLLLEAAHVDARISVQVHRHASAPPVQQTTTQTNTPVPGAAPPSESQNGNGHGEGQGHGRGHGHGGH